MKPIRNSVKALILEDGKVLAIELVDKQGNWYVLPGGGQEPGETFHETLQRECLEEIGTRVEIRTLRFVREYLGSKHEFADHDADVHQIEFMFECSLPEGAVPSVGRVPDSTQTGVVWLELAKLDSYRLYPLALRPLIANYERSDAPVYLGEIN